MKTEIACEQSRYSRNAMRARSKAQIAGACGIDVSSACTKIGVSRTKLYNLMAKDPSFPKCVRIGSRVLLVEAELERWFDNQRAG